MKIKHDTNKEIHIEFKSVFDIQQFLIENYDVKTRHDQSKDIADDDYCFAFSGTKTYFDFMDIVENGSDEIISNIKLASHKYADSLNDKYETTKDYKFDVYGQFFDVGLVLSGEPEAWVNPIDDDVKKQIEISVNASYLSDVKHEDVINNASRIIGMILTLEKMGVETKLLLNFRSNDMYDSNHSKIFMVSLIAKEYEQGIDYKKLSCLLHTSMFRRGIFRMREVIVGNDMKSYGRTKPLSKDTLIDKRSSVDELERKLFRSSR
ncbi:MAG: hypothetical protein JHC33_05035 [Ignisphaera sp.]|nr:hypothetical protein [Ignisphaera sp.]